MSTRPTLRLDSDIRDWRQRLDARISRCRGCDQWCWDGHCDTCTTTTHYATRSTAA